MLRAIALLLCMCVCACAGLTPATRLKPGVSSEQDVIAALGKPANVYTNADGSKTLDLTKQPDGRESYFVTLAASGKVVKVERQLAQDRLDKIQPGMKPEDVLQILGKPGVEEHVPYTTSEIWTWYPFFNNRLSGDRFQVGFTDGVVVKSAMVFRTPEDSCEQVSCTP